jgi:hypothetical protein
MKTKTIVLAFATLFSTAVIAQTGTTTFGIRAGVNFTNITGKNEQDDNLDNKLKTGFHAGVNAEIPVGIDFYLQPGVLFTLKGSKDEVGDGKTNISYIEIPINFIYKPELGTGRLILGFGPYAAFGVDANRKNPDADIEFGDQLGERKRFDAGANLLAGYEFANRLSFQLNAGLGLVRINNRADNDKNSSAKNTGFGVSLGYRFGR